MTNALIAVAFIIMFFVIMGVLSRAQTRKRRLAEQDLEREKAEIGHYDILDLVREEVAEKGIAGIPGGSDVDPSVLLRVWHRDEEVRDTCPDRDRLRFVVAENVPPAAAEIDDVALVCDQGSDQLDDDRVRKDPGEATSEDDGGSES